VVGGDAHLRGGIRALVLTGLTSGRRVLRIQQIGYRAVTLTLAVNAAADAPGGTPGLDVSLCVGR